MMETDQNIRYLIEYKSILLDILEKYKTFERVNLARFLRSFRDVIKPFVDSEAIGSKEDQEYIRKKRSNYAISEFLKPERHSIDPKTEEILCYSKYSDWSDYYDSPEIDSMYVEDITAADRREILNIKGEILDPIKRFEMVTFNPQLPDGIMLKFRKCNIYLIQTIPWQI